MTPDRASSVANQSSDSLPVGDRKGVAGVFVDRDGTLMRDVDYCGNPNEVELLPGTAEALRTLRSAGFKVVVVTNQSGIGRGFFTDQQYHQVEDELARQLGPGTVDATYYCPHH